MKLLLPNERCKDTRMHSAERRQQTELFTNTYTYIIHKRHRKKMYRFVTVGPSFHVYFCIIQ